MKLCALPLVEPLPFELALVTAFVCTPTKTSPSTDTMAHYANQEYYDNVTC